MGATNLAYHLRPNKAVERQVMLSLLSALSPTLDIAAYRYVGMGGPFLEDFRLIHSHVGIEEMVCVERDETVHMRQKFNRPNRRLELVWGTLEDYLRDTALDDIPGIYWLDFTNPRQLHQQIDLFCRLAADVAPRSLLKMTLNANPTSLGTHYRVRGDGTKVALGGEDLERARLEKLRERIGQPWWPPDASHDELSKSGYGALLGRIVSHAVQKELAGRQIDFHPLCSFIYSDSTPMFTITGVSLDEDDLVGFFEQTRIFNWEFYNSKPGQPVVIDLPVLSAIERLLLQRYVGHGEDKSGFVIPEGRILSREGVAEAFRVFYRMIPQFSRVDI